MSVRDSNQRGCAIAEGSETKKVINPVYSRARLSTGLCDLFIIRCGCLDAQLNGMEGRVDLPRANVMNYQPRRGMR